MSESIVRKVQPFTIGTRLSVPQTFLQSQTLDNCNLHTHNLNSLYLSRSQVCAHLVSPTEEAEDHLNQNVSPPPSSAVSRSIKKITISGSRERPELGPGPGPGSIKGSRSENNNNNNNVRSSSDPHLPRIVGVSCENKPSSHFKVKTRFLNTSR